MVAVGVVGAGPAGLMVTARAEIPCVLPESESRAFIEQRPRRAARGEGAAARGVRVPLHRAAAFRLPATASGDRAGRLRGRPGGRHASEYLAGFGLSDIFHHTAATSENPFAARIAEARMRRLLGSPAAAAAFAELYIGKNADL